MKKIILIAGMCSAMHLSAQLTINGYNAYTYSNAPVTAASFLRICPDARAGGMGDGSIALSNDANAMHWNISKLAFAQKKYGFSASYVPWVRAVWPGVHFMYAAGYGKLDSVSAISASLRHFSMGRITFTTATGAVLGEHIPKQTAVDVGYTRQLTERFSAGIAFRYIYSNPSFDSTLFFKGRQSAFAGDLGLTWRSGWFNRNDQSAFRFITGVALTNVGSKFREEQFSAPKYLPINLGLAQGVEWNFKEKHDFAFQVEINKLLVPTTPIYEIDTATGMPKVVNGQYVIAQGKDPNRPVVQGMFGSFNDAPGGAREEFREIMWSAGIEYAYRKIFKVRAGYFHEHKTKGYRQFATVGCGVAYQGLALDFSYLFSTSRYTSPLENTFRLTLLLNLNQFKLPSRKH